MDKKKITARFDLDTHFTYIKESMIYIEEYIMS